MVAREMQKRHQDVLSALVRTYIDTAEPVSSGGLVSRHRFGLSSATIRNVMSDLERMGYLVQPHTSAGRIPTEKAYRYYVDKVLDHRYTDNEQAEQIKKVLSDVRGGVDDLLRNTSRILSDLSRYPGLVLSPRKLRSIFRSVNFIRIRPGTVLVVLVSISGITENRLVRCEEDFTQEALDNMSGYLNTRFSGMGLAEMRKKVLRDMRKDRENFDRVMRTALELGSRMFDDEDGEIYVEGSSSVLDLPEFTGNIQWMRQLLRTFEDKRGLIALLDEIMVTEGITVYIGSEAGLEEMNGFSIVASTYGNGISSLGTVGIIGPTRMDYSQVIPLVTTAAEAVSENLSRSEL